MIKESNIKHDFKLLQTRQWGGGNGHIATEKCQRCGRIAKTSINYRGSNPVVKGNYNIDNPQQYDLSKEECTL